MTMRCASHRGAEAVMILIDNLQLEKLATLMSAGVASVTVDAAVGLCPMLWLNMPLGILNIPHHDLSLVNIPHPLNPKL
jgi:hypothetical protein